MRFFLRCHPDRGRFLADEGSTVLFAGMALFLTLPWWVLLLMVLAIFMQFWRAKNEARVLEAKFGDVYRPYRAKTRF
jgi:protein-S-isoprenylcysteine O-methyltransferase Ste14